MNMTIKDYAIMLAQARQRVNKAKEELEQLQAKRDSIQADLLSAMKDQGAKTAETDTHIFSKAVKQDIRIVDEKALTDELKKLEVYDQYTVTRIDTIGVKSFAKGMLKEVGEVLSGTEPVETEYISIREKKA